jgi:quinoprotein glucose dehydrogenase
MPSVMQVAIVLTLAAGALLAQKPSYRDWQVVAGGQDGIRYSSLKQVNRGNVHKLKQLWRFDSGDEYEGSEMQCNPIVIDGVLYATTPRLRVVALDAASGKLLWDFDPRRGQSVRGKQRNRGLVYWSEGDDRRLFVGIDQYLYAVDARSGKPAAGFGTDGRIDLRQGLGRSVEGLTVRANTPGVIYKDLLILGSMVSEDLPSAPGYIRAFDVRTGKLRWTFHTIPKPGEFGYDTWPKDAWREIGGANSWAGLVLDDRRGIVYVPTGSAAYDFYGANRSGDNLFANCLLALKADTGERVWHFQFVRHDVWDRDLPSPPSLVRVKRNGKLIDGVAQITKSGHVWVFDRDSGKSLFPYREVDAPPSEVEGEVLARKQVLPDQPAPFARQQLMEDMLTRRTPEAHADALERFRKILNGPQFTPPSMRGTFVFPGYDGGGEWGGPAFDPQTGIFYVNSNEMAWVLKIVSRGAPRTETTARALYERNCMTCHRADMRGTPPEFPSLVDVERRRTKPQIEEVIRKGAGRMPGYVHLGDDAIGAVVRLILTGKDSRVRVTRPDAKPDVQPSLKYSTDGYNKFLDPDGYPAIAPPWGTLNAINLHTGKYVWKIPFGEFPELAAKGMRNTGSENYGGPIVTAGGLLFIAATNHDRKFRAFDKSNGKLLWETVLPASGNATPAIFEINGKQIIVIGAGGGKSKHSGGSYLAFGLD